MVGGERETDKGLKREESGRAKGGDGGGGRRKRRGRRAAYMANAVGKPVSLPRRLARGGDQLVGCERPGGITPSNRCALS